MACRIFCHLIVKIKMLLELLIIWHRLKLAKLFLSFQCECGSKLCTHFKSSSQFRLFSTKHQKPENPLTDNLISGCERNVYAMRKVSSPVRPPTSIDFKWIHNILHLPSAQTHAAAAADELPKLYHFLFACFFLVFLWHYCRITHTLEMVSSECGCFEILTVVRHRHRRWWLRFPSSHRMSKMYHFEWLDVQLKSMDLHANLQHTNYDGSCQLKQKSLFHFIGLNVLLIWMRISEE